MAEAIDMRHEFPEARDQGVRPTCLAFAISDAHMFAADLPGLLAPEYLHFHAAQLAGVSQNAAVGVRSVRTALESEGQPLESECPYSDCRPESWTPPSGYSAIWTRRSGIADGNPSSVLSDALVNGRAPVLVFRVSRSFHAPAPSSHVVQEDGGYDRRLHAVLIVGEGQVASSTAFLARNSWGRGWGEDGHAWLPDSYVNARASEIVEVEAN